LTQVLGGPLNADYGLPFANTIANQSMSMINPVDRALINQEATLRGQQMSREALKASQLGNTHQDLINRQLGVQERQWAPQADFAAMEAQQKMRTLPGQTDAAVQDLILQNSPEYRSLRNQMMMTQPKAETTKMQGQMVEDAPYTGKKLNVRLGGKDFDLTPATQKEYQNMMLKLLGYESDESRSRMSAAASNKPTDMENFVQRRAADLAGQGMPKGQALVLASREFLGEKAQTVQKGEVSQENTTIKQLRAFVADPIKKIIDPALYAQAEAQLRALEGGGSTSQSSSQKVRVFNPNTGKLE